MTRPKRENNKDRDLSERLQTALSPLPIIGLRAEARNGVAYLTGVVATEQLREQAEETARQVPGVRGMVSGLVVERPWPSGVIPEAELEPLGQADVELESIETIPGTEPDLNALVGTTDPAEAADGSDPYFPPTDPVVRPIRREEGGIEVVGGWAPGSMDEPFEPEDHPRRLRRGDDEIAQEVEILLREDASTADLNVHVFVRRGIVHLRGRVSSLDEADSAAEVASRVPDVEDVQEELEVEGI